jgi:hypothetical protein
MRSGPVSQNDFRETCPWCGRVLDDQSEVESKLAFGEEVSFFRIHFSCSDPECGYWLKTRCESFNVLKRGGGEPDELEQRVRLDQAHTVTLLLMPHGVASYSASRVALSRPGVVEKTASDYGLVLLHTVLADLVMRYRQEGRDDLAERALDLALDELKRTDPKPLANVLRGNPILIEAAAWVVENAKTRPRQEERDHSRALAGLDDWLKLIQETKAS